MNIENKNFFHTQPGTPAKITPVPFRLKSMFMPPGQLHSIEHYTRTIKHDVSSNASSNTQTNLSPKDFAALESLKEDKNIIIKPADKGGGVVIMDYSDYRDGMLSMLADSTSYMTLKRDPSQGTKNGLSDLISMGQLNGWLTDEVDNFLRNDYPRMPVIYGLPKIYKVTTPLKFQPIVSGTGAITQPMAQFIDFH